MEAQINNVANAIRESLINNVSFNTNLIGKFCTFASFLDIEKNIRGEPHLYFGEIVGTVLQNQELIYNEKDRNHRLNSSIVLIVRLGTFDKDRLVEIPACFVKIHENEECAKQYVDIS